MSSEPYIGAVKMFGFSFAPRGYMIAAGQLLSIQQYTALFSLYGVTYGGNGQTTFGIPNLQGRTPNGQGQLAGGGNYVIGQQGGSENVTLTQAQMPQHNHAFSNNGSALNAVQVRGTDQAPDAGSFLARGTTKENTATPQLYVPSGTTGTQVALGGLNVAGNISIAGGSQPHSNLSPFLTLNFSVAVQGLFPSRN